VVLYRPNDAQILPSSKVSETGDYFIPNIIGIGIAWYYLQVP
jgi:hypothetical protein